MDNTLSRRSLVQRLAWAAGGVTAAFVATACSSQEDQQSQAEERATDASYYSAGSITVDIMVDAFDRSTTDITTTVGVDGELPGFSLFYVDGEGEDTTATLEFLEFHIMVPSNLTGRAEPTVYEPTGEHWSVPTVKKADKFIYWDPEGQRYQSVSTEGYTLYTMTFTGEHENAVTVDTASATWPGTNVRMRFHGTSNKQAEKVYVGYVTSYTTDNGFDSAPEVMVTRELLTDLESTEL